MKTFKTWTSPILPSIHPCNLRLQHAIPDLKQGKKYSVLLYHLLNRYKCWAEKVAPSCPSEQQLHQEPPPSSLEKCLKDKSRFTWHKNRAQSPPSFSGRSQLSRSPPPSWAACAKECHKLPCLWIGCATAWTSSRQLQSMESSPFQTLWHSLNNYIYAMCMCIDIEAMECPLTSPTKRHRSPSSCFQPSTDCWQCIVNGVNIDC